MRRGLSAPCTRGGVGVLATPGRFNDREVSPSDDREVSLSDDREVSPSDDREVSPSDDREVSLDPVEAAVAAIRQGLPACVVDDADRENEGDVILAAALASREWVGWAVRHTSGVLCVPMPAALADALDLPPMVARNQDPRGTAYTVSVDAAHGVTTGISAADRATTARLLAAPTTTPGDLNRPGHLFPLRARDGGVLERRGHTEAAVDLCRLAGLPPVGVIAELVEDDGSMMRLPAMRVLADSLGLPVVSIDDLATHRRRLRAVSGTGGVSPRVQRVVRTELPTRHGRFAVIGYRDLGTGAEHVAIVAGTPSRGALVRVHSECLTGDALGSLRCDCGPQLDAAIAAIARTGQDGGVVVYLRGHEGRGIGLLAKLTAYALQDEGLDTVAANLEQGLPVDAREYGAAASILADLGVDGVRLMTNNPDKITSLAAHGVDVLERVPLHVGAGPANRAYLRAKRDLMGHLVDPGLDEAAGPEAKSLVVNPHPSEQVPGRGPGKAAGALDSASFGGDENAAGRRPGAAQPGHGGLPTGSNEVVDLETEEAS